MNNHMTEEKEHEGQPARQLFSILSSCFVALVALVTVFAALSFGTILYHAVYSSPDQEVSAASLALADATGSASAGPGIIPASLIIPSLNIDSQVDKVGITTSGSVGTPPSFTTTAWYEYGPKPGSPGMAIIDGHVNNGLGLAGVFLNLDTIKIGADIYVADTSGKELHFVVTGTSTADYNGHLDDVTANQTSAPQLVLITCEGKWIPSSRTYDKRIVVLADLK
jgi:hypothetical protein